MSQKTEKATPFKLQKAKEKGQVSKSTELNTCICLLVTVGIITALWPKILIQISSITSRLLLSSSLPFNVDHVMKLQQFLWSKILNMWLPLALTGVLTIVLTTIAQTGLVWTSTPLVPDFKRINLAQGMKKLFSTKTLFEGIKTNLKLLFIVVFLFFSIKHQIPHLMQLSLTTPKQDPSLMMRFLLKIMFQLVVLLGFFAVIDQLYTRWKFQKDQRMSKQDLKDEYKQREGDPKIKVKIRQLQQQLRQKTASLNQVKTADIVITNPTHLAIALKYDKTTMPAPKVVSKGQDELAWQIKKLAKKHGVPVIENKPFARALFDSIDLNQWITRDLYPIAAGIFRTLYQQKSQL